MSCHYSQEREEEFLEPTDSSDGNAGDTSSGNPTAKKLYGSESTMASSTKPQSLAMSEHSSVKGTPDDIGEWLMSLPGDSHVSPSVSQESSLPTTTPETCGLQPSQWFAKYDRAMCSWKTCQGCLPGLTDISDEYLEAWPKQGMMRDGVCWEQTMLELRTEGKGSGLWPTATTDMVSMRTKRYAQGGTPLTLAVQYSGESTQQTWPTPDANMPNRGTQEEWVPERTSGHHASYTINQSVRDSEGSGQLNPDWVEWLMGWPIGWTSLEPMPSDAVERWKNQRDGFWSQDPADDPSSDVRRTSIGMAKRKQRLQAIGNGQVPFSAATAWEILREGIEK